LSVLNLLNELTSCFAVGCINTACCATLIDYVQSFNFTFVFGYVLLLICMVITIRADFWLYNETTHDSSKVKVFSRTRAFWIIRISLVLLAFFLVVFILLLTGSFGQSDAVSIIVIHNHYNKNITVVPLEPGDSLSSCTNKIVDGEESDIDCGGSCSRCSSGQKCSMNTDCADPLICNSDFGICSIPDYEVLCGNNRRDFGESDTDCGGTNCDKCIDGYTCTSNSDCVSRDCSYGICVSCYDGILNGQEADVDCGAPSCFFPAVYDMIDSESPSYRTSSGLCDSGSACKNNAQCDSGICYGGTCVSCINGEQDGLETDIDCGGMHCQTKCGESERCFETSDCSAEFVCDDGFCVTRADTTCAVDSTKNGFETDVDCGGGSCPRCADGKLCGTGSDCFGGYCESTDGVCFSCNNGIQDGDENDVDCGGSCSRRCGVGSTCTESVHCAQGLYCWTQLEQDSAEDHFKNYFHHLSVVSNSSDATTAVNAVFPSIGSCQVPFTLQPNSDQSRMSFYMRDQVIFDDLMGVNGESIISSTKEEQTQSRRLSGTITINMPGSGITQSQGKWPFLCTLTIVSKTIGSAFDVKLLNDAEVTVKDEPNFAQTMTIKLRYQSQLPLVYVRPR